MPTTVDPRFQSDPEMMKATRMLIIDHDICRYHSFDLFRWLLYQDTKTGNREHFCSLRPEFYPLLDSNVPWTEQIRLYRRLAHTMDPHAYFTMDAGKTIDHEAELNAMFADPDATITETDINVRLDPIFERKDLTGFLLRYRNDPNHPIYQDRLRVIETDRVLDVDQECQVVIDNRVNAIFIGDIDQAILLTDALQRAGYKDHITFIIATYGYNYLYRNGAPQTLKANDILGTMEVRYGHEYGYFDPFTGITARYHEEERNAKRAEGENH